MVINLSVSSSHISENDSELWMTFKNVAKHCPNAFNILTVLRMPTTDQTVWTTDPGIELAACSFPSLTSLNCIFWKHPPRTNRRTKISHYCTKRRIQGTSMAPRAERGDLFTYGHGMREIRDSNPGRGPIVGRFCHPGNL